MTPNITPLERAFALAKSGRCRTTEDIYTVLKRKVTRQSRSLGPGSFGSFARPSMRLVCLHVAPKGTPTAASQTGAIDLCSPYARRHI